MIEFACGQDFMTTVQRKDIDEFVYPTARLSEKHQTSMRKKHFKQTASNFVISELMKCESTPKYLFLGDNGRKRRTRKELICEFNCLRKDCGPYDAVTRTQTSKTLSQQKRWIVKAVIPIQELLSDTATVPS